MWHEVNFMWNKAGLDLEFSFWTGYQNKAKKTKTKQTKTKPKKNPAYFPEMEWYN